MRSTVRFACAVALAIHAAIAVADVDWTAAQEYSNRIQAAVAKRNPEKIRLYANDLLKLLPAQDTTYYAGVTTGRETALTVGVATDIVGTSYSIRVNQFTRAAGEVLSIDRHVPGLAVIHTGENTIGKLLEYGYSYRFQTTGEYPVYGHAENIKGVVESTDGPGTYAKEHQHDFHKVEKDFTIAADPDRVNWKECTRHRTINLILADVSDYLVNGRKEKKLVVKAVYKITAGKAKLDWGNPENCEGCFAGKIVDHVKNHQDF
jgi:hypothetical protein